MKLNLEKDIFFSVESEFNLALHTGDIKKNVIENRIKIAKNIGKKIFDFVYMNQIHSGDVITLDLNDKGKGVDNIDDAIIGDAIITDKKGLVLIVLTADCIPVIFYDKVKKVVGVAHAGWKGTYKNISGNVLSKMKYDFNSNMKDILIYIGVGISKDSFEVGKEVALKFDKEFYNVKQNGKYLLDLKSINKKQLLDVGILEQNIEISNEDSFKNKKYFSARRDGFDTGRFGTLIYLK